MSNEIIASNSSIIHNSFNYNQLINLANGSALTLYTTTANEYLDLIYISNGTINRFLEIKSVSDVGGTSVILSLAAGGNVNVFNTANKLIVPPNYTIVLNNGGIISNLRVIVQGTRFYNSP